MPGSLDLIAELQVKVSDLERQLDLSRSSLQVCEMALLEAKTNRDRMHKAFQKYGTHLNDGKHPMCGLLIHSDNGCTCGFDKVIAPDVDIEEINQHLDPSMGAL